jgi:hypothetical protein
MRRIESMTKSNTLMYIPNAITITHDKSDYFFASFIDRDLCFNLLNNMMEVEKRICELAGADTKPEPTHLVFGYQHRATILASNNLEDNENDPDKETVADEGEDDANEGGGDEGSKEEKNKREFPPELHQSPPDSATTSTTELSKKPPVPTPSSPGAGRELPPIPPPAPPKKKNSNPPPKADALFKAGSITLVAKKTLETTSAEVWDHFWKHGSGYE